MTPTDARRRALTAAARWLPACTRRPAAWFSDDAEDRWYAAQHCARCPIRAACAERGRDEPAGVWGGVVAADRFELVEPVTVVEHVPSRAHYVSGCREPACVAANTEWIRSWRNRPVTAAPTIEAFEQLAMEVGA